MVKYFFIIFFLFPAFSFAQWSNDPNINLQVCDVNGEQALPKISNTTDGGCYICWFDSRQSGYRVYLQRLNSTGFKQFATDGLLISSNPQNTSLVDYDMITDDSNNAIIVFTDTRNGSQINPFAYKISPQGNFLWGSNGVTLSNSFSTYQPNPKVINTSDGNYVIVWIFTSTPRKIAMQKLSPTGALLWGTDPIYLSGSGTENLDYPSLVRSDSGSVILLCSGYIGSFLNPMNYRLYSQKYSSSGTPLWNSTLDTVYSLGRVSGFFVPKIFSDGNNGALYVWHDDRNSVNLSSSFVQHFSSTDVHLFPANGSEGCTTAGMNKFDAWAAFMPLTGETYMFWKQTNSLQSQFAIYGQRFSSSGTRLWTDAAREFKPFGSNATVNQICFVKDTSVVVYFNEAITGSTNNLIKGFISDRNGIMGWGGSIINISTPLSQKLRLVGALDASGVSKLAWSDQRQDAGGIYAQNINFNGTLGNTSGIEISSSEIPEKFSLYQNYPNPFNPSTHIKFDIPANSKLRTTNIELIIYDILGRQIIVLVNQQLKPGTYEVEWNALSYPSGVYFYSLKAGDYYETKRMVLIK